MGALLSPDQHFPLLSNVNISLSGSGPGGGRAILRDGARSGKGRLSPGLFAFATALAQFALRSEMHDRQGSASSFMSAKELAAEIKRLTGGRARPDQSGIANYAYRLRNKLGRMIGGGRGQSAWAARLLEGEDGLGYRWSTPAENVHLDLADVPTPNDLIAGVAD